MKHWFEFYFSFTGYVYVHRADCKARKVPHYFTSIELGSPMVIEPFDWSI